jgi:hypothetical protein
MKHYHVVQLHTYAPGKSYWSEPICITLTEDDAELAASHYRKEIDEHEQQHGRPTGFYSAAYYACEDTCDLSGLA